MLHCSDPAGNGQKRTFLLGTNALMHARSLLTVLIACIALWGCQGGFFVKGRLPAGSTGQLLVEQTDEWQSLNQFPQKFDVSGEFSQRVPVDPSDHSYRVSIRCEGRTLVTRSVNFPKDVSAVTPLELGVLEP